MGVEITRWEWDGMYREQKLADTTVLAQCWFPGLAISNAKI